MSRSIDTPAPLRRALLLDAAASGGLGLLLTVDAAMLQPMLGLPTLLMRGAGLFLLPFAAMLFVLASRAGAHPGLVRLVVIGNALWVLASLLLLAALPMSPTLLGQAFVVAQAAAVAVFAYLEHAALQRGGRATLERAA